MIIIILGMHRSGTSTVAGVLHLNKVVMGTYQNFWPRPLVQNPKGFYENYDFRKINDQLLNNVGYDVKSYQAEIPEPELTDQLNKKMKKLILYNTKTYTDWGWKDPRTCLTIPLWSSVFSELELNNDARIIFVSRSAGSTARSLKKRNDLPLEDGIELWKIYNQRALKFCENSKLPTYYCSFEEILKDSTDICAQLFRFLDRDWDKSVVDQFIDSSISTSGLGEEIEYPEDILNLEKKISLLI